MDDTSSPRVSGAEERKVELMVTVTDVEPSTMNIACTPSQSKETAPVERATVRPCHVIEEEVPAIVEEADAADAASAARERARKIIIVMAAEHTI